MSWPCGDRRDVETFTSSCFVGPWGCCRSSSGPAKLSDGAGVGTAGRDGWFVEVEFSPAGQAGVIFRANRIMYLVMLLCSNLLCLNIKCVERCFNSKM